MSSRLWNFIKKSVIDSFYLPLSLSTDSSDEAGKTLAIIIGLMAAVALIIIFASFLRKAGNSK